MKNEYMCELEDLVGTVCDKYCKFLEKGPFHDENSLDEGTPLQCDDCDLIKIFSLFEKVCKEE